VVLTGSLGDGASGLAALKQCGGIAVVQDPKDASYPEMPATALGKANPNYVAALADMPALLGELVRLPAGEPVRVPHRIKYEVEVARNGLTNMTEMDRIGRRSVLACPDCHGVMWEIDEGELVRYRCHVGHAYTAELMALALDEGLNRALAAALRGLDERISLAQRLRDQAQASGHLRVADSWSQKIHEYERESEVIRSSVHRIEEIAAVAALQREAHEPGTQEVAKALQRQPG
jgi:two-component system chemotaxis response regulator CheB